MSKWVVDIHGDIEGDYEIIKKYEEPKTEVLDKIRAEIEKQEKWLLLAGLNAYNVDIAFSSIKAVLAESEEMRDESIHKQS